MLHTLDIDTLKTFLAIADSGSFTRAAAEVNKTQSAVSMQMKRLEEVLERRLFMRDGRASRITADGERLIDYARRMVDMNDEAVAAFTRPDLTGTVRFGTPDDYADRFLPEILGRFARSHPQVIVEVECLPSCELQEHVQRGDFDLAMVTASETVVVDVAARREPLLWVTSQRHSVHLRDEVPLAVSQVGCEWRNIVLKALAASDRPYRIAYASSNSAAINAAVLAGLAVGAVPDICLRPGMRVLSEKDGFPPLGHFDIGLIHKTGRQSSAVQALSRHVAESLGQLGTPALAAE